jgi:hypothetical protein
MIERVRRLMTRRAQAGTSNFDQLIADLALLERLREERSRTSCEDEYADLTARIQCAEIAVLERKRLARLK